MTARWVVDEVQPHRELDIVWQPISLLFKNEPEPGDRRDAYQGTHDMLRVMEALRAAEGDAPVFDLYWEFGRRIHHDRDRSFDIADALTAAGLDPAHATAASDESFDAEIRTRMDAGLALVGQDVGTPIIAFPDPAAEGGRSGIFGPVITRVPDTERSLAVWDAMVTLTTTPGFWELKRTRTERPEFGDRP